MNSDSQHCYEMLVKYIIARIRRLDTHLTPSLTLLTYCMPPTYSARKTLWVGGYGAILSDQARKESFLITGSFLAKAEGLCTPGSGIWQKGQGSGFWTTLCPKCLTKKASQVVFDWGISSGFTVKCSSRLKLKFILVNTLDRVTSSSIPVHLSP